jgi:hypothetical protein
MRPWILKDALICHWFTFLALAFCVGSVDINAFALLGLVDSGPRVAVFTEYFTMSRDHILVSSGHWGGAVMGSYLIKSPRI